MIKNAIAPIQAWLLSQGKCVGCGRDLSSVKHKKWKNNKEMVTCKCRRMFVYEPENKTYRRALIEEVSE